MYLTNVCDPQVLSLLGGGPTVCSQMGYRNGFSPAETRIWACRIGGVASRNCSWCRFGWCSSSRTWSMACVSGLLGPRTVILLRCQCPLLVDLLPRLGNSSSLQLDQLVQSGRKSGLLCASPRLVLHVPHVELSCYQLAPPDLPRHQPGRAPSAPRNRAHKPATRVCGRPGCSGRDVKCPSRPRL
jgi:hypothetical protein